MKHITTAVLILLAGPALAEPIPRPDTDAACRQTDNRTERFGSHAQQYRNCMAGAQENYDKLKSNWDKLTDADQKYCINDNKLSFDRQLYYMNMWGCTNGVIGRREDQERRARDARERLEIPKQELRY